MNDDPLTVTGCSMGMSQNARIKQNGSKKHSLFPYRQLPRNYNLLMLQLCYKSGVFNIE